MSGAACPCGDGPLPRPPSAWGCRERVERHTLHSAQHSPRNMTASALPPPQVSPEGGSTPGKAGEAARSCWPVSETPVTPGPVLPGEGVLVLLARGAGEAYRLGASRWEAPSPSSLCPGGGGSDLQEGLAVPGCGGGPLAPSA